MFLVSIGFVAHILSFRVCIFRIALLEILPVKSVQLTVYSWCLLVTIHLFYQDWTNVVLCTFLPIKALHLMKVYYICFTFLLDCSDHKLLVYFTSLSDYTAPDRTIKSVQCCTCKLEFGTFIGFVNRKN